MTRWRLLPLQNREWHYRCDVDGCVWSGIAYNATEMIRAELDFDWHEMSVHPDGAGYEFFLVVRRFDNAQIRGDSHTNTES